MVDVCLTVVNLVDVLVDVVVPVGSPSTGSVSTGRVDESVGSSSDGSVSTGILVVDISDVVVDVGLLTGPGTQSGMELFTMDGLACVPSISIVISSQVEFMTIS
jgi:hypothetical protein